MTRTDPTEQDVIEYERRKRQRAADFARASVQLEGFTPSAEAEAWIARLVAGQDDAEPAKGS
jgi:hypothetical protein